MRVFAKLQVFHNIGKYFWIVDAADTHLWVAQWHIRRSKLPQHSSAEKDVRPLPNSFCRPATVPTSKARNHPLIGNSLSATA